MSARRFRKFACNWLIFYIENDVYLQIVITIDYFNENREDMKVPIDDDNAYALYNKIGCNPVN